MMRGFLAAALALLCSASGALAEKVMDRIEINATADAVWAAIGDFCGIQNWHPAVASCEVESDGKARIRTVILKDGGKLVEKEINRNNLGRAYSYKGVETPLPVEHYAATIKVLPIGKTKVNVLWMSAFKPIGPGAAAEKSVSDLYVAGLKGLKAKIETPAR
ncbi:SRPBCC family protein [Methylocapsa aurea]|uniref:SRPBCC family protein n=1 Tax=Methylocapsa aurea TaxID=663610 RepID=UPI00055CB466|nr:SRPBCC family protein [Methylocapsa aurea]